MFKYFAVDLCLVGSILVNEIDMFKSHRYSEKIHLQKTKQN